jgi:hypothetical protein
MPLVPLAVDVYDLDLQYMPQEVLERVAGRPKCSPVVPFTLKLTAWLASMFVAVRSPTEYPPPTMLVNTPEPVSATATPPPQPDTRSKASLFRPQ